MSVMAPIQERLARRSGRVSALYAGNARAVIERGLRVIRNQNWGVIATGFFEPVFYLLAMGMGMGALVGTVPGPDGQPIAYAAYIAPALLATSAMNGAIYDSVNNVFFKLRYSKLYEGKPMPAGQRLEYEQPFAFFPIIICTHTCTH